MSSAVVVIGLENGAIAVIDNGRQRSMAMTNVEVFGSKGQAVAYNDTHNNVELYTDEDISG